MMASKTAILLSFPSLSSNLQQSISTLSLIFTMQLCPKQLQKEISELIDLSAQFQKDRNFEYSLPCYRQIIGLLESNLLRSSDYNSQYVLKAQIEYYEDVIKATEVKIEEKGKDEKKKAVGKAEVKPKQNKVIVEIKKVKSKPLLQVEEKIKPSQSKQKQKNVTPQKPGWNAPAKKQPIKPVGKTQQKKKSLDPDIENMVVRNIKLTFKDIIGMKEVKDVVNEAVIRPKMRPDLFQGIRAPPRGILFYGPPGNGKTYIAKALANEAKCTFFAVSASSIMTKWVGESQKMLRKLFEAAQNESPSIIFIDEIDSLLTARTQKQNQASRRVKTQFLVMMDGMMSAKQGDILLIGATNLPHQLDLAVLRRFNKLIYIGLPDPDARSGIVIHNMQNIPYKLSEKDLKILEEALQGYSASEIKNLCKEVAMQPLRELSMSMFQKVSADSIREIGIDDFLRVIKIRKPLLSKQDLKKYEGNFGDR